MMSHEETLSNILVRLIDIDNAMNKEKYTAVSELLEELWEYVDLAEAEEVRSNWLEALEAI